MRMLAFILLLGATAFGRTEFWAPAVPPRAHYAINIQYVEATSRLEGSETIRFRNNTRKPIGRVALDWFGDVLRVRANGAAAAQSPGKHSVALFDLPNDIQPGAEIELQVEFGASWRLDERTQSVIASYLSPRLWWGFGTLDDYEVRLKVPDGYAAATSGRYDPAAGAYRATGVRVFGLFLGKGYESAEADAGDVRVRAVFTQKGRPCAELLLKAAVDVIQFYRERFGFYPQRSLSIVPGMDYPAGGYPSASGLVVVHGQNRFNERRTAFWRWITAHEIGHMYWGDYVMAQGSDSLSWLMIGLGIHADQDYRRARSIGGGIGALERNYINGVKQGRDTTVDVTAEQESAIEWDFNNTVTHGKSIALLNALESVIGADTFESLYRRCLREYAGRQLGWREFQRVAESESEQDLDWFFEQWVRSSDSVAYRVVDKSCSQAGAEFDCRVQIQRSGGIRMPITVAAVFQDGSEQRARTERLADIDELTFRAKAAIKDVVLDPDSAASMVEAPQTQAKLVAKIREMPWTGVGAAALEAYTQAKSLKIEDDRTLRKLALLLYDGRYYEQALDLMKAVENSEWRFAALVWQGHLLDLLGRRPEAVARYEEALKMEAPPTVRHDQYGMTIDKHWVEERLKAPFERK